MIEAHRMDSVLYEGKIYTVLASYIDGHFMLGEYDNWEIYKLVSFIDYNFGKTPIQELKKQYPEYFI